MRKSKSVIIDTNLWISYLISDRFKFLDDLIEGEKIKLCFSEELIEEFIAVTQRPGFKKYFSLKDVKKMLTVFDTYGALIDVTSDVHECRDEKDNFLLNLAIDSKADYLVTGDADLLSIEKVRGTKILTIKEFRKIIE